MAVAHENEARLADMSRAIQDRHKHRPRSHNGPLGSIKRLGDGHFGVNLVQSVNQRLLRNLRVCARALENKVSLLDDGGTGLRGDPHPNKSVQRDNKSLHDGRGVPEGDALH